MKIRTLIIAGLVSFLLTSLTQIPARLVLGRLPDDLPLKLQGINGSLWEGSATSLRAQNLQLRDVQWNLQPTSLFKGQAAAKLKGNLPQGGDVEGVCGISFSGKVQCHDLLVNNLPANTLTPYLQSLLIPPLRGQFQANLDSLTWDRENPPQASGHIEWQEAGIQLDPNSYGQYSAILSMDADDSQQVSLTSAPDAAFSLDGRMTLQADRQYQLNINVKPGRNVQTGFLGVIGAQQQPDGSFRIERQGSL